RSGNRGASEARCKGHRLGAGESGETLRRAGRGQRFYRRGGVMAKEYRSALALEQAVKAAARRSGQDVGRAVEGFYAGRLLERVFSEERKPFVLKGGRGILARTLDARYTTDTDFLYRGDDLEEALGELK